MYAYILWAERQNKVLFNQSMYLYVTDEAIAKLCAT